MSAVESAELMAQPLDPTYLSTLLDSVSATQGHLAGNKGTPLLPSFLPPGAVWSAEEKDRFFHALSVNSRYRPDLISHEIKTKSVQDVCNYLSILQVAASEQEITASYFQCRKNLPIAMEVSSEWVAMEEEKAAGVITREQVWQRELIVQRRSDELKLLKKVTRAGTRGVRPSQRKAELNRQIADANLRVRQEDFCASLGPSELAAIGAILHEATDSPDSSQVKSSSVLHASTPQRSAGHVAGPEATKSLPFFTPNDNYGGGSPPGITEPLPAPPDQDSIIPFGELSPASRRRHQKRLHMRRKRASSSGATVVDDTIERLKPGPKKFKRSSSPGGETLHRDRKSVV